MLTLGTRVVEDHRDGRGGGWVWLADPAGNDFCVERAASERPPAVAEIRIGQG